jgi:hypothetical protein
MQENRANISERSRSLNALRIKLLVPEVAHHHQLGNSQLFGFDPRSPLINLDPETSSADPLRAALAGPHDPRSAARLTRSNYGGRMGH